MIRLSCATISTEGFGDTAFERTFRMLPQAGYRYVEFNLWHPAMMTPAAVESLRRRCELHGLIPSSVHAISLGTSEEPAKEVSHKLWMLEICRRLGCRMLSATGHKRGSTGGVEGIIDVLRHLVPVLEDEGMQFSLENHQGNNLEFIEDVERVLDAVGSDAVGVCIDTGHFEASGVRLDDVIGRLGPRVNHIHVKENRAFGTKQFVRFGEGTTDNRHVIRRMADRGYDGYVVVELSPQSDRPTSVEDLRLPRQMLAEFERPDLSARTDDATGLSCDIDRRFARDP